MFRTIVLIGGEKAEILKNYIRIDDIPSVIKCLWSFFFKRGK
jgi:hypothetical protein